MATIKELKQLAIHSVKGTAPAEFSCGTVDEALRGEMNKLAGSLNEFMRNRYDIYEVITTAADEVVPNKVISAIGIFADVRQTGQGQKAIFTVKKGKMRAKKFLTQVGLSGVYETFRLDSDTFELGGIAVGGAGTIDFERFLDGAESMTDIMDVIVEGLTDAVFVQVHKALRSALNAKGRPAANKVSANNFDAAEMAKLVNVVRAYGQGAVIFAPPEFVAAMGPDAIVPAGTNYQGVYSPADIEAIHNTGYVTIFRGTPVVQIPQSFVDENNNKTWIDPQVAYILPTGGEKVVKVVLEGNTQIWDFTNKDQSMEIHAYRKMGVAILTHYNWAIYQNTGIAQTYDDVYGF